jgi:hypothetical protein
MQILLSRNDSKEAHRKDERRKASGRPPPSKN